MSHQRVAIPPAGREWVCKTCGEVCAVEKQDIGPYEGREVFYAWVTDCCSGDYEDRDEVE